MPECQTYQSLLSFGIIADVQYADADDAYNYDQTRRRYYRNALDHTKDAVCAWNNSQINFAVQLGDLIDGRNRVTSTSERALTTVLNALNELNKPIYHVIGNHELYCFRRNHLENSSMNSRKQFSSSATGDRIYYTFSPSDKFRIIVLDTFDVSMLGVENDSSDYKMAEALIRSKNANDDLNSYENLPDKFCHYTKFNGGIGDKQLLWLEQTLQDAEQCNENVLILGHIPLYEPATDDVCLVFNYERVLDIFHAHAKCIVAYFAGHDHKGGYAMDSAGIHHVTFDGIVEVPPQHNSFATVHVYADRLELQGHGLLTSRTMLFK